MSVDPRVERLRRVLLTRIASYGYTHQGVLGAAASDRETYTYTIGLPAHIGHPELAVCGVASTKAIPVIGAVVDVLRSTPNLEGRVTGALEGDMPLWIAPLSVGVVAMHLGGACWWRREHHDGQPASARQISLIQLACSRGSLAARPGTGSCSRCCCRRLRFESPAARPREEAPMLAAETRTSQWGAHIPAALVQDFIRTGLRHEAVADFVAEYLFDALASDGQAPAELGEALRLAFTEIIDASTSADWQRVGDDLVADARENLEAEGNGPACAPLPGVSLPRRTSRPYQPNGPHARSRRETAGAFLDALEGLREENGAWLRVAALAWQLAATDPAELSEEIAVRTDAVLSKLAPTATES